MPTTIKDLQTELAALQASITQCDYPAKQAAYLEAEVAHSFTSGAGQLSQYMAGEKNAVQQRTHTTKQAAYTAMQAAESEHRDLTDKATALTALLTAGKQHTAATAEVAAAETRISEAQKHLDDAKAAQTKINEIIQQASTEFDVARTDATAALLRVASAGGDIQSVPTANRDKLTGYELAATAAAATVAQAEAVVTTAKTALDDAQQLVKNAISAGTALAHELALRDYLPVFLAHRRAYFEARHHEFPVPRFDLFAMTAERTE